MAKRNGTRKNGAAKNVYVKRPHKAFPVAIVGAGMIPFGELFHQSYDEMVVRAYQNCLKSVEKGIGEEEIQAGWIGTCNPNTSVHKESPSGTGLSETIRFFPRPVTRVENACCTGTDAVRSGAIAVTAGLYDIVLVVGAEKMRDVPPRESLVKQVAEMFPRWWEPRGASAALRFGAYATAHMHEFGTTRTHFAKIAVKNHENGLKNPVSHFKKRITVEEALNAPLVSWPFGLYDCCPTTDGAAAVILTRADIAKRFTDHPLYLWSAGLATDPIHLPWKSSYLEYPPSIHASRQAYDMAGITAKDVDLAEVHDCFTGVELIDYEDLGFCPKGKGGQWVDEGGPMIGGEKPVNPSGGLKAKGHPVGATGVAQLVEMWEQLRGKAGERQVKNARIGLTHTLGGLGTVSAVLITSNEPR